MKKIAVFAGVAVLFAAFAVIATAAEVSGTYKQKMESARGTTERTIVLKQSGNTLTGKVSTKRGEQQTEQDIKDGKVTGDQVEFKVDQRMGENTVTATYKAKVTDEGLEGTVAMGEKPPGTSRQPGKSKAFPARLATGDRRLGESCPNLQPPAR